MVDGGETRSVLEPATATATGAGPAPVIVPDVFGSKRTADGPREGIAGTVTKAGAVHIEGVFRGRLGRRNLR